DTGHHDDLSAIGTAPTHDELAAVTAGWDLDAHPGAGRPEAGEVFEVAGGDVVTSAPELARLTLNVARVHHDAGAGERPVYGWHGCDHLGPVRENDTLTSTVEVERLEPLPSGTLAHLRSRVRANRAADVLDWRFAAVLA